jgi:hypothetical protein
MANGTDVLPSRSFSSTMNSAKVCGMNSVYPSSDLAISYITGARDAIEARMIPSTGSLHRILVAIIMASCFLAAFISTFPFTRGTMLFGNFFLTFSGRLSALLLFILPSSEVDDRISFVQSVQTSVSDYHLLQLWLKNQAISAGAKYG